MFLQNSSTHLLAHGFRCICESLVYSHGKKNPQSRDSVINISTLQLFGGKNGGFLLLFLICLYTWLVHSSPIQVCQYTNWSIPIRQDKPTNTRLNGKFECRGNVTLLQNFLSAHSLFLYLSCHRPVNCSWTLSSSCLHFPYRSMTFSRKL